MKIVLARDIAAERRRGRDAIDAIFAAKLAAVMSPVSPIHAQKAIEADRLLATVPLITTSPLLKPEAKQRGITEAALARMIKTKRDERNAAIGAIEALRQKAQAEMDAATSPAAIDAVIERYR